MMVLALLGWTLARPLALAVLALPLALFLLSFRRQSPRTSVIGTLRFFRAEDAEASAKMRRRLSKSRWAAIVAMLLGTVAAVGPRPEPGADPPQIFTVWVDRSPSMFLPLETSRPDGRRRIDAAVDRVRGWLTEQGRGAGAGGMLLVRWSDASAPVPGRNTVVGVDEPPPARLTARPTVPMGQPVWSGLDQPGALHVTDAAPTGPLRHAGLFTSGGPAVPGPVAAGADGLHVWTGDDAAPLELDRDGARPSVRIVGPVAGRIDAFVRLWAEERGVEIVGADGSPGLELLTRSQGGPARTIEAGRDGWSAVFAASPPVRLGESLDPWLVAADGRPLVGVRKGAVTLYFDDVPAEPSGPAEFAVSWSRLLDGALLPPSAVVPSGERRAAGSPRSVPPRTPPRPEPARDVVDRIRDARGRNAETWFTALAALAGLVAFALRLRGSP